MAYEGTDKSWTFIPITTRWCTVEDINPKSSGISLTDEVHKGNPCVGIVDKAAFRKGEAAIMIARKADNTEGFVSFHRYVDNLLQCPTVRRARLRDREVL